jgi:hypothetical protein
VVDIIEESFDVTIQDITDLPDHDALIDIPQCVMYTPVFSETIGTVKETRLIDLI